MKTNALSSLLVFMIATGTANAQDEYSDALSKAATGPTISVGTTVFRIIPDVSIRRESQQKSDPGASKSNNRSATAALQNQSSDVLGNVGPFVIVPRAASGNGRKVSSLSNSPTTDTSTDKYESFGVAVNTRSGEPVVVAPRVKLFSDSAKTARALAKKTGGEVVQASTIDGSALIKYSSITDAQAALGEIKSGKGVEDAYIDVIENFKEKQ